MSIERIVPGTKEWDSFYANHICRYQFAKDKIESWNAVKILDAACGVGYGSSFLAQNSSLNITAIDRSNEALDIASRLFTYENTNFIEDDCHTFANTSSLGPFDAIISFETLEHLPFPDKFITNCFNSLKTGGDFIVSTPNQLVSSPSGNLTWEFHEKEYSPYEFIDILTSAGFKDINLFGQQMTEIGILRDQIRFEINRLNSNPFMRFGRLIQKYFRGHKSSAVLCEQSGDFKIDKYTKPEEIIELGLNGPFVLIATCKKS
jgi:SAM-dependent methyltransferase